MNTSTPLTALINSDMEQQRIQFNTDTANIAIVEKLVTDVCKQLNIDDNYYGNILVALTEAVNNAIHHGNKNDLSKKVDLTVNPEKNKVEFVIKDEGPGFDFENLPDPTAPENLEKENGRGIFLMKNLADSVDFEDNGRIVKLGFNLAV